MEIVNKQITEILSYENNPRKNDKAVESVVNSIKEFGFKVPIILDKNNIIIAGHTRYKAALKLNLKEVPCVIASDLTEEQVRAFRIADNKVSELSEWDFDLLNFELENIIDLNMEKFGFNDSGFSAIEDLLDEDFVERASNPTEFSITFNFPTTKQFEIEKFIKDNGKEYIVDKIVEMAVDNNGY